MTQETPTDEKVWFKVVCPTCGNDTNAHHSKTIDGSPMIWYEAETIWCGREMCPSCSGFLECSEEEEEEA